MKDLKKESAKLDPRNILEPTVEEDATIRIDEFKKLRIVPMDVLGADLVNILMLTGAIPFAVMYEEADGTEKHACLFASNNNGEFLEIAKALDTKEDIGFYFEGTALPYNENIMDVQAYHGQFIRY